MRSVLVSTLATIAFSLAACRTASPPAPGGETVILIHGMGRSTAAMAILARRLELDGALEFLLGEGEIVLVVQGSSARLTDASKDAPTDATIMAIVDSVEFDGRRTFTK